MGVQLRDKVDEVWTPAHKNPVSVVDVAIRRLNCMAVDSLIVMP